MPEIIDFAKLEQIYNVITAIDAENDAFHKALRAMNVDNNYFGSDNVHALEKLAYSLALSDDKQLVEDFEYLLYETPMMEGGGSIMVEGKQYPIRNFADLRRYWLETKVIDND